MRKLKYNKLIFLVMCCYLNLILSSCTSQIKYSADLREDGALNNICDEVKDLVDSGYFVEITFESDDGRVVEKGGYLTSSDSLGEDKLILVTKKPDFFKPDSKEIIISCDKIKHVSFTDKPNNISRAFVTGGCILGTVLFIWLTKDIKGLSNLH